MKFSYEWLKMYLETLNSPEELSNVLTDLGLEVESLTNQNENLAPFKIGYIKEAFKHPNADRLQVCHVDVGLSEVAKVVCGAQNARPGIWVAYAPLGSLIPGTGQTLRSSQIRGVISEGMLCSQKELGLSQESDGTIMELKGAFSPGLPLEEALGKGDIIFDLSITPNRPDCFGVFGIARDLAAKGLGTLKERVLPATPSYTSFKSPLSLSIDPNVIAQKACSQIMGCYIKGVKNCESPLWLKRLLVSAGLTPISALVDITNYLSLGFARPLHVFDAQKISDLTVRFANDKESFDGLNGKNYTLNSSMLVIADKHGVQNLAGIMGGASSRCTLETQDVFLEGAVFSSVVIGKTGQKLMIQSEARQRFERGVDPLSLPWGFQAALDLILEICGGEPSEIINVSKDPFVPFEVTLTYNHISQKIGFSVSPQEAKDILERLGFVLLQENTEQVSFRVPSWRFDITQEEDLIEEILRLKGYNTVPNIPLPPLEDAPKEAYFLTPFQEKQIFLKRLLAQRGFLECVNYSFISSKEYAYFSSQDGIEIENPISQEMNTLRPSLLPGLLKSLLKNQNQGFSSASLFELASIFKGTRPQDQHLNLTGIRRGETSHLHFKKEAHPFDFFNIKGDSLAILEAWGLSENSFQLKRDNLPSWFHPHLSAGIYQGPQRLFGFFGALHPNVVKAFDLDYQIPIFAFEIFLNTLPSPKYRAPKKPLFLSSFQRVTRDFAFILDKQTEIGPLIKAIYEVDPVLIEDIFVFDIYYGKGLLPSQKSVALHIILVPQAETLKESDIKTFSEHVIEAAQKIVGAFLRQ